MVIEIQPVATLGIGQCLVAVHEGQRVGRLDYVDESGSVHIEDIRIQKFYRRQGIGRLLLREFTQSIGHGRFISAVITHMETLHHLDSIGLFSRAIQQKVTTTDPQILLTLPISRVLISGGINPFHLEISLNEQSELGFEDKFNVDLLARVIAQ